jgi:hypothetical protein
MIYLDVRHRESVSVVALDHDDFGLMQSKIMNVIDSNNLERDAGGKSVPTFPHPALADRLAASASPPKTLRIRARAFHVGKPETYSTRRAVKGNSRFC